MSTTKHPRTIRYVAVGVATAGICVASVGLAFANPASDLGQAVGTALHATGVDWSSMPEGYTRAQYEAFWGADYTTQDQAVLEDLWNLDATETKARAGQMILDGEEIPVAPGSTALALPEPTKEDKAAATAFLEAGYAAEDIDELSALWDTEFAETKIRAGHMLLDNEDLPIGPARS